HISSDGLTLYVKDQGSMSDWLYSFSDATVVFMFAAAAALAMIILPLLCRPFPMLRPSAANTDFTTRVYGILFTPACSNVPPGLWYLTDVTCPALNVADAKSLLDAAKLPAGSDGNRTYNGKVIDLLLCTTAGNSTRLTELQKLQGDLKAIGIKSHIVTADASSVVFAGWNDTAATPNKDCEMYRGNYDMVDYAYIIGGSPYSDNNPVYSSDQWPEKGDHSGANDTRFSSSDMDAALKILSSAVDPKDQLTAMVAVQKAYIAGLPEIPLYYRAETTGVGVHAGNWPGYNPSSIGPTWDVEDWFFQ
ncbi:MAG: ABC transporter substrate-binding protein, partial [Isosphaeraceae bacterium]